MAKQAGALVEGSGHSGCQFDRATVTVFAEGGTLLPELLESAGHECTYNESLTPKWRIRFPTVLRIGTCCPELGWNTPGASLQPEHSTCSRLSVHA